jgi:hypothetical protein
MVEAQHHVSTAKLTDTQEEQELLERLLEDTKPPVPPECRHLDYLLSTPFRYGSRYPGGSRFRRAGFTAGVFYASEAADTAAAEMAFLRLVLFFAESPATPWPANAAEYTAFAAEYASGKAADLTRKPFYAQRAVWMHPTDYEPCQAFADVARDAGIEVIRYTSVRAPGRAANLAILTCRAFARAEVLARQTWRIHFGRGGARAICEAPKHTLTFDQASFANDPRVAAMNWGR